jgi:hypothetical protein
VMAESKPGLKSAPSAITPAAGSEDPGDAFEDEGEDEDADEDGDGDGDEDGDGLGGVTITSDFPSATCTSSTAPEPWE